MRKFFMVAVVAILNLSWNVVARCQTEPKILGQWKSGTFDGIGPVNRAECTAVAVTERSVRLDRVANTNRIEGEWLRWWRAIWMNTDNGSCRWGKEDASFRVMNSAIWDYILSGEIDPSGNMVKIHGELAKCDGDPCGGMMATIGKPFDTELRINRNRLVDTGGSSDPTNFIQFIRISDQADMVEEANESLEPYLRTIDSGEIGNFYAAAASSGFKKGTDRIQFEKTTGDFQSRAGRPKSRKNLTTLYVVHAPAISKDPGEYLFVWNGIETTKGRRGSEFLLLVKEGPSWKVFWMNYGS